MKNLTPINNIEAEQALLGSLLMEPKKMYAIETLVETEDFYADKHKLIYQAIKNLLAKNIRPDIITLSDYFGKNLDKIGGRSYFAGLMNTVLSAFGADHYAKIVQKKAYLRRLMVGSQLLAMALEKEESDEEIQHLVDNLSDIKIKSEFESQDIRDLMFNYFQEYHSPQKYGIKTGFPTLDKWTMGLQKGDLVTLLGKTSVGKTNFVLTLALNALKQGKKVLYASLEMLPNRLIDRIIAINGNVSAWDTRNRKVADEKIEEVFEGFWDKNFKIYYNPEAITADIVNQIRKEKENNGLDLVIVDYLGRLNDSKGRDSEEERLTKLIRTFKNCALRFEVPVVTPIAIDKNSAKNDSSDIESAKGSSSIGYESDLGLVFKRKKDDFATIEEMELYISKNRNGETGMIPLNFNKINLRLYEQIKENVLPGFQKQQSQRSYAYPENY